MKIQIRNIEDVSKVIAFARAGAKAEFVFAEVLAARILAELKRLARDANIAIQVVSPDEERVARFALGGLAIGGLTGLSLAGPYGLALGAILGAAGGYAAAHVVVRIDFRGGRGTLVIA